MKRHLTNLAKILALLILSVPLLVWNLIVIAFLGYAANVEVFFNITLILLQFVEGKPIKPQWPGTSFLATCFYFPMVHLEKKSQAKD